jgi:hypothetical protein
MKKYLALTLLCLMSYSVNAVYAAEVRAPNSHTRVPHATARVPHGHAVVAHTPIGGAHFRAAALPPLTIKSPEMVVVSSGNAQVYMTPKIVGLYLYGGYWYRYYGGAWFRATAYNGEWIGIAVAPAPVVAINPIAETRTKVAIDIKPEAPVVEQAAIVAPAAASIEVTVKTPPILEMQEPELVVVPSEDAYVYMIPTIAGVYFYDGYWYRYYEGAWFRADIYNGPWIGIAVAPTVIVGIDPFYPFYLPAGYYRIGYTDFHAHWRGWGHDRHWHNHAWFKHEMKPLVKTERLNSIKADRSKGIDPLKKSLTAKKETLKSSKSLKSVKAKKGDKALKSVKSVKANKSVKKDQLNKDNKGKLAKTNKSIAKKNSRIKKSDLSVKGDKLNTESKTKLAKSNNGISSGKKSIIKKDDLVAKGELANKNLTGKSDHIIKSDLNVKNAETVKGIETAKSVNIVKGDQTLKSNLTVNGANNLKSEQTLKNSQTLKKAGTFANTKLNNNLQTSRNIQANKSFNKLPGQQSNLKQNGMQKSGSFERR